MDTIIGKNVVFFTKNKVYRNIQFSVHEKKDLIFYIEKKSGPFSNQYKGNDHLLMIQSQ
jgi:hypothetical protein